MESARVAKDVRAADVTAGWHRLNEQFVRQRVDRSIARTRLTRSPTYDLDVKGGEKSADDIGAKAPKQ
jgi:hypothetical protein